VNALELVTLNPARQLGIDADVGSLEPGKVADFILWSGHPLAPDTVCLQTWIEGRKYHDVAAAGERADRWTAERDALLAKARLQAAKANSNESPEETGRSFFHVSLEHEFDGRDRHCMDEVEHE
jgi:cytosine/adenosine deaminase-related metal-dependent hydrolase